MGTDKAGAQIKLHDGAAYYQVKCARSVTSDRGGVKGGSPRWGAHAKFLYYPSALTYGVLSKETKKKPLQRDNKMKKKNLWSHKGQKLNFSSATFYRGGLG